MRADVGQRGAVMVVGLVMSLFLCGLLAYLEGVASTLFYQQHLQDAADVSAFAAAVAEARGMNLIVLINLVMMGLLATLVALKLIQTLASIALVAVLSLVWLFAPLASTIPFLEAARESARAAHKALEPLVMSGLRGLHLAAEGVRVAVPAVAQAKVVLGVAQRLGPPVESAFSLPARLTLPVEPDAFEVLCKEAEDFVAGLVMLPLKPFLRPPIEGTVHGALSDLASAGTAWYCGDSDAEPPSTTLRYDRALPVLAEQRACLKASEQETTDESRAVCERAAQLTEQARADDTTGSCVKDCEPGGAYERVVQQARVECDPSRPPRSGLHVRDTWLENFEWQERRGLRRYRKTQDGLVKVSETLQSFRERSGKRTHHHPCGRGGFLADEYVLDAGDLRAPQPVCTRETPHAGDPLVVDVIEVSQILGCTEPVEERRSVADFTKSSAFGAGDSQWKRDRAPMRVVADLELGDDDFQIRAVTLGVPLAPGTRRAIALATGRRSEPGLAASIAAQERFAIAQAEYFYEPPKGTGLARSRWLWNRGWRARLRRVRLGQAGAPAALQLPAADQAALDAAGLQLPGLEVLH
jgi:hypothetical protein